MCAVPALYQVQFRALHNLPAGEELTQSYFPLHTSFHGRQQRCREQYGFECTCPRCKVWTGHSCVFESMLFALQVVC